MAPNANDWRNDLINERVAGLSMARNCPPWHWRHPNHSQQVLFAPGTKIGSRGCGQETRFLIQGEDLTHRGTDIVQQLSRRFW